MRTLVHEMQSPSTISLFPIYIGIPCHTLLDVIMGEEKRYKKPLPLSRCTRPLVPSFQKTLFLLYVSITRYQNQSTYET